LERVSGAAEHEFFTLPKDERDAMRGIPEAECSPLYGAAEAARERWDAATKRVQDAKPVTLAGVIARVDFLAGEGELDFDGTFDVLRGIAERQPDLAITESLSPGRVGKARVGGRSLGWIGPFLWA
jgi:hypothetical protein